jgi:DNA polymerase I
VNERLVYFDASWLAHRAKWAMKSISGSGTEIIFGFLEQMRATCLGPGVRSNRAAFFFDSRHSFRRQVFPAYKAKRRNKTPEELAEAGSMAAQLRLLRTEILPDIGFNCFRQAGLESDDLIAQACEDNLGKAVIVTADEDLLQCISLDVHWFDSSRDKYMDLATMIHEKRVNPNDWVTVKCLAGCSTDGVPGIPGIGEKTATDYLWRLVPAGKKLAAINSPDGQAIAKRNYDLIRLPHPATRPVVVPEAKYNPDALFKWGEKLGFKSYFEPLRKRAWELFFRGDVEMNVRKRNHA